MKHVFLTLIYLLNSVSANAALPPVYQNAKDLAVMVRFVEENPDVMEGLKTIDFENYRIKYESYTGECTAVFTRENVERTPGWVGPADALIHEITHCSQN